MLVTLLLGPIAVAVAVAVAFAFAFAFTFAFTFAFVAAAAAASFRFFRPFRFANSCCSLFTFSVPSSGRLSLSDEVASAGGSGIKDVVVGLGKGPGWAAWACTVACN